MAPQKVLFLLFFFLYSLSYILLLNAILRLSAGLAVLSHVWEISLARQNLCPNCLSAKTEAAGPKGPFFPYCITPLALKV